MAIIVIPNILKEKLGEDGTKALIDLFNQVDEKDEKAKNETIKAYENRFERRMSEEIGKLRVEMQTLRTDIIKWMFIFWVGQAATVAGILFAFFGK